MTITYEITQGDWVAGPTGRPGTVSDLSKARQDMNRLLSIETQENGEGAGLQSLIGTVPSSPFAFGAEVQARIRDAIKRHQALQARGQFLQRTRSELIARIVRLYVTQYAASASVDASKTGYLANVDVLTASGLLLSTQAALVTGAGG